MGPRYEALLSDYVKELRAAKDFVNDWWAALVAQTLERVGSEVTAAEELRRRWPVGPAAHPRILAVVRKYYLACDVLNRQVQQELDRDAGQDLEKIVPFTLGDKSREPAAEPDLPLSPGVVVRESLFSSDTQDLARIIGKLTYWPIGVDAGGRYV